MLYTKNILYHSIITVLFSLLISAGVPFTTNTNYTPKFPIKQVVVWGHKLHSHTHSYIHWAFVRAFEHLGYKTLWLDKNDIINNIDFTKSLFITEGQVDQNIPLRSDCHYILHNCDLAKYKKFYNQGNCILLQVYTHDCLTRSVKKIDTCMYKDFNDKTIYLPWATDLLPDEIEDNKKMADVNNKQRYCCFIGSVGGYGTMFGNGHEIEHFKRACQQQGLGFLQQGSISPEDNITVVRNASIAPAIQGQWQIEKGYIPCRIFKNISYGAIGVTNSKTVYDLFNGSIVYNHNTYELLNDACNKLATMTTEELHAQMDFVKEHHTYLNRIDQLLIFLDEVKQLVG